MKRILLLIALVLWSFTTVYGQSTGWDGVEKVFGGKGASEGDMFKVTYPRGDLAVKIGEVRIAITAIHSHMLFESPRLFFLHSWGYDDPEKLANGLKAALDKINLAK
ncbi:MAG TPA: DUF1259 domain-containing protein [Thermodesulfovibrionales bacterium]|nr:DUF1259 domain-containing protein [Thermodesulfovibrionales bacterium]